MKYSSSVRRQVCLRLRGGESVVEIAADTGISPASLFRWKGQALIDAGVNDGVPSVEADELAAAHHPTGGRADVDLGRVRVVQRPGSGLPTRKVAIVRGLIARGHSSRSVCRITGLNRSTYQFHRRRTMPTCEVRRLVVADAIGEIHRRSRGVYGKRRIRVALLEEHEMIVNHKLVEAIMRERGMSGLPRPRRRKPGLLGVDTPADLVQRRFTADGPNELWFTDIERHEALLNRVEVGDLHRRVVAAAR